MRNIILQTRDLCKTFKGQKAVNNISLSIEENSLYGLLGPNGAGKSTTLKMITRLASFLLFLALLIVLITQETSKVSESVHTIIFREYDSSVIFEKCRFSYINRS